MLSAMSIFLVRPQSIWRSPSRARWSSKARRSKSCGSRSRGRVMGPARSCGKKLRAVAYSTTPVVGGHVAPVDVDDIREVLEDVVADADGQHQVERHPVGVQPDPGKKGSERVGEEPEVLEDAKRAEVDDQGDDENQAAVGAPSLEQYAGEKPARRDAGQQQAPAPIPQRVEDVAQRQQRQVLQRVCPARPSRPSSRRRTPTATNSAYL